MTGLQGSDAQDCGCDAQALTKDLVSVGEALDRIAPRAPTVGGVERLALGDARGRILAEPVVAQAPTPPFDNAAMDGYAVCTASLTGGGPWTLPVAACVAAGHAGRAELGAGATVQIFTGAPVPIGADAVVMQEQVARQGDLVTLRSRPEPGQHLRRAGEDMAPGQTIVPAGCRLGAREIAAAAAAGSRDVAVRRKVRVAILATGDELRQAGDALGPALIWDVNSPMVRAAITGPGTEIIEVSHGGDCREALRDTLSGLAETADLIVTTGGVSVGAADYVKPAVTDLGGEVAFSGVAIKPGKPVCFGRLGRACWLGLPGNPVSALVTWTVFGTRLLDGLSGLSGHRPDRRHVVSSASLRHKPGRCEFRMATLSGFDGSGREVVSCPNTPHSARVSQMIGADGLVLIPADADAIPKGGLVAFLPFDIT